jgi:hypothetical protein
MPDEAVSKPRIYTSAFFCQDIVKEQNNLLTAVRIGNSYKVAPTNVTVEIGPGFTVSKQVWLSVPISAVLTFHSDGPVDFNVVLKGFDPDGIPIILGDPFQCRSEGGSSGQVLNTRIDIGTKKSGDHRIDVYVDGIAVTRAFFNIIHVGTQSADPQSGQSAPSPGASE